MKNYLLIAMLLFTGISTPAQDLSAYQEKVFAYKNSVLPYRLLLPAGDTTQKYPLLIFLHGAFEKGNDNEKQLSIGGRFFMRDSIRTKYPAYIIFPQCPEDDSWAYFENQIDYTTGYAKDWNFPFRKEPTPVSDAVQKLISEWMASGKIDLSRIYIAGLSQGGMGVLDLVARYPNIFAAALSMCGAGEPATTKLFAGKVPLWLFHGDKDPVVPPSFSREYYKRLKKANAEVRYSEYKNVEHNCWINAFAEPDLLSWLFSQKKMIQ